MGAGRKGQVGLAGLLSAVLPGLGQFYNGQRRKGMGFFLGLILLLGLMAVLIGSVGGPTVILTELQRSAETGVPSQLFGLRFLLTLLTLNGLVLGLAVWSIIDAARSAHRR